MIYSGIIIAVVGLAASICDISLDYKRSKELKLKENEKLELIAYRAEDAINPIMEFLSSFLAANGLDRPLNVFLEDHEDELGKSRPAPYLMDPIMDIFSKSSLFTPSNMSFKNKRLSWLQSLRYYLRESNYRCDVLIKHYGSFNHPLIE